MSLTTAAMSSWYTLPCPCFKIVTLAKSTAALRKKNTAMARYPTSYRVQKTEVRTYVMFTALLLIALNKLLKYLGLHLN